ncbi:uncharacterized protein JCM10292_005942 [Rhodotorula paludigena]|uniref:uncharacterized protein n=1 Tax=Rhodotorula paludigena TaxID=86838 RepID=UPI00316B4021
MTRLPTQPELTQAVALRSGFYALPLSNGKTHLFARAHHAVSDDSTASGAAAAGSSSSKQLFVTGLPLGISEKGLRTALGKVWSEVKVKEVRFLETGAAGEDETVTVLEQERLRAAAADEGEGDEEDVAPLLLPEALASSASSSSTAPTSAIVTFSSTPALPPAAYPSSTPLTLPVAPSFLSVSRTRHALARPPRSVVTAHVDDWMRAFDAQKLAAAPPRYSAEVAAAEKAAREKEDKKRRNKKGAKRGEVDVGPVPGSAAEALAKHAAYQARMRDPDFNPDEEVEGEWQTVSRGGKHGKSLLPTGVTPTVTGYGGVTVKVAGKKRGRASEQDDELNRDAGIKKIVGEGFYRFNQAEGRRKQLANLQAKFEEDKRRLDRMRGAGGAGAGRGRGRGQGRFKPY